MSKIVYNVGELKSIIRESSRQEFNPKLGPNVMKDNATNNEKSYKESQKRAKNFDGGLSKEHKPEIEYSEDGNKNITDSSFDNEPSKEYKERVKAQVKGYTSKMEETNGIEKSGDFETNAKIYDANKKKHAKRSAKEVELKKSGLTARNMDDSNFEKASMYENSNVKKATKRLFFKHTKFLSEEHMLSLIPEEYKVEGQRIIMKDSKNNEYLVEWKTLTKGGKLVCEVVSHKNSAVVAEKITRIKELFGYNSSDFFKTSTPQERLNENNIGNFIDKARKISDNV